MNFKFSASCIYFFHYCKIIAVYAEFQQRLARVPDDLAADLDEVEEHGAQAEALRELTRRRRPLHSGKRRLADHPQAVVGDGRDAEHKGVGAEVAAREQLDPHVALQLAVELLAGPVVMVQPDALARLEQIGRAHV